MLLRIAAVAAFAIASCLPAPARSRELPRGTLTLDDAFARVAQVQQPRLESRLRAIDEGLIAD